ncbi:MAG: tetratricopeptide repeat protein [Planctomycetota bacterium]|jgi:tetratricopeptide (TPR) repeat protein
MTSRTNLNILDLPNIFQSLADNRRTGVLRVKSKGQEKLVLFREGNINMVVTPMKSTMLGEALLKTNVIDELTLKDALTKKEDEGGGKLGALLLKMKKISEEDLVKALTFQVTEEVCELFTWEDVFCEFMAGEPTEGTFNVDEFSAKVSLPAGPLIMEAARRIDEWEHIKKTLPSVKDVLVLKKKPSVNFRGTLKEELLRWVDGLRDVEEVIERARMSRFNALKIIRDLIDEGFLRARSSRELVEAAKLVGSKGRGKREAGISKIIKLYERAEELGINNPKISLWLAQAYERLKKQKESVTRYKTLGKVSLESGNLDDAVKHYRKIVAMNPDDLESHERLVETLLTRDDKDGAAREGVALISKYRFAGRASDAMPVSVKLEAISEGQPRLLGALAEMYMDAGDNIQGLILYEGLADHCEQTADLEEAIATYRRMLEIDNENIDAHFRLAQALTKVGRTGEAVKRYKVLADILTTSGVLENSINWQFLINVYEHLVAIEPGNLLAREWLADAYVSKKDFPTAIKNLRELLNALSDETDPQKLISPLRKLVDLVPDDLEARDRLGGALSGAGEKEEAISEFAELANLAFEKQDVDLAMSSFEKAISLDPTDPATREGIGKVFLKAGRAHEAAAAFRHAAILYVGDRRTAKAVALLRNAVEADPERLDPLLDLGNLHKGNSDLPSAQTAFQEFASKSFSRKNYGDAQKGCLLLLALNQSNTWAQDMMNKLKEFGL